MLVNSDPDISLPDFLNSGRDYRLGRYLKRSVLYGIRRPGAVAGAARFPRDNVDLAVYRTRRLREAGACPPGRLGPGNVLTANYPSHPSLPPQSKFNVFGSKH